MVMRGRGTFARAKPGGNGIPLNDPRALERLFNQQQYPSPLKELTHPGKGDPKELLMRCIFKDSRERNAAVLYYAKCMEFNLKEEMEVLANWLASTVSVQGLSRRELLMGHTNIIAPSLYPGVSTFGKKGFGGRKKEEGEQGEQ